MSVTQKLEIQSVYNLSPMQQGMLFHSLLNPDAYSYFQQSSCRINGSLDVPILDKALNLLVKQHDVLRTNFVYENMKNPKQIVFKDRPVSIGYQDITEMNDSLKEDFLETFKVEDRVCGFNLSRDPLLRLNVFKIEEQKHELVWSFHHIIMDGWCMQIVLQGIFNAYNQLQDDQVLELGVTYPYADYIKWLEIQDQEEAKRYWQDYLDGCETQTSLPKWSSEQVTGSYEPDRRIVNLEKEYVVLLEKIAREQQITVNAILQSAWGILLSKYNNTYDVIFGTVTTDRPSDIKGIDQMIGLFINTLPVRISFEPEDSFTRIAEKVHHTTIEKQNYSYLTLADIQSLSSLKQNLIDHLYTFQNFDNNTSDSLGDGELWLETGEEFEQTNYDFNITIIPSECYEVRLDYNTLVYDTLIVQNIANHFKSILETISINPNIPVKDIQLLTKAEAEQILTSFNKPLDESAGVLTFPEMFELQVEKTPEHVALIFEDEQITYKELNRRANRLAWTLRNNGTKPEDLVGIMADRSVEMIVGVLGIIKAGAAYVPIDPDYPDERISYILGDCNANLLLTHQKYFGRIDFSGNTLDLDDELNYCDQEENLSYAAKPENLLYVIYTSGSTGRPKGVMINHFSYACMTQAWRQSYNLDQFNVKLLQLASFSFDVFAGDLARGLLFGGQLILCPGDTRLDIFALYDLIKKYEINIFESTPKLILPLMEYIYEQHLDISFMKLLILGADICQLSDFRKLLQRYGKQMRIVNSYGVTEATIDSVYYEVPADALPLMGYTPIGKPLPNVRMYILGADAQLQPIGVPGELCIAGPTVARGYLNKPELSAEKFIDNPVQAGERLYKTGDMARWFPDGNIDFLGRVDHQVKIRGFRIEMGEIESQLLLHPHIQQVAIAVKETSSGDNFLCAYLVCNQVLLSEDIRSYLSNVMPDYMIPSAYVFMEDLPLSHNGKVDRKALPEPDFAGKTGAEHVPAKSECEKKLAGIWEEVLGVSGIGLLDHFFALGGHSLKAMILVARVGKDIGIKLSLRDVFQYPTLGAMAKQLEAGFVSEESSITSAPKADYYPLSSAQRRLFVVNQMQGQDVTYNMPFVLRLEGLYDQTRLEAALQSLVERHDAFRTSFILQEGEAVQKIHNEIKLEIDCLEMKDESKLTDIIDRFITPFDLRHAPLFRVSLVIIHPTLCYVLGDMHHIISDGASIEVLVDELAKAYSGEALPELRIQYKDYAVWQQQEAHGEAAAEAKQYWLDKFAGEIPVLNLATDFVRPPLQSFAGASFSMRLGTELTTRLKARVAEAGTTLYMYMLSAYYVLLSKYSGQEDIVVGTAVAGRSHADVERMIGMFVSTLALRSCPVGSKTFAEYLQEVHRESLVAFEHQQYPYEELIEQLNLERDMSRNPLFDTMFVVQNTGSEELELEGLTVSPVTQPSQVSKFDWTVTVTETGDDITLDIEYATSLFRKDTMERMMSHYLELMNTASIEPNQRLSELEMITAAEREEILYNFNDRAVDYPREKTVHQLFEEQVAMSPEQLAIAEGGERLSYRALNERANALAWELSERGVGSGSIVAIMADRSVEIVVGMLAVLKAGGAYLPIAPDYPVERIQYMLEDSEAKLMLVKSEYLHQCPYEIETMELKDAAVMEARAEAPARQGAQATDLVYMMYTSGSTGQPKGVMVEHRGVVRLVKDTNYIHFERGDRILQTGAQVFDASTFEIWGALLNGLELFIIAKESLLNPELLEQAVRENDITIMWLTAPLFDQLAPQHRTIFEKLRVLLVGGDTLTAKNITLVKQTYPNLQMINGYGPTENTTFSCCFTIDKEYTSNIPIGRPIANSAAYIVDEYGKLMPIGVPGQLLVSGDGVAKGYRGHDELNAEKFIPDPFNKQFRAYQTGDRARWLPDGNIEYLGRMDYQLKIRGFRVELGEIELEISKYEDIKESIVVALEGTDGQKYLCAYVAPAEGVKDLTSEMIRQYLIKRLPEYMIPTLIYFLDRLPLNHNGKVDRKALPKPSLINRMIMNYVPATSPLEKKLEAVWRDVLGVSKIGLLDNFFSLGGHSLKAMTLVAKVIKELKIELNIREVFQHPTLGAMVALLETRPHMHTTTIEAVPNSEDYPLSSAQKRLFIVNQIEGNGTAYNMPFVLKLTGNLNLLKLEAALQTLTERHDAFRTSVTLKNGEPVQRIADKVKLKLERLIIADESELESMLEHSVTPFDLSQAPLLRAQLVQLTENEAYLLIDMHHIISDGISVGVLVDELAKAYSGEALPELRIQYKDYAVWQQQEAHGEAATEAKQYWLDKFAGEIPVLNLATDFVRPPLQSFAGASFSMKLGTELTNRLKARVAEAGTTLYMYMLSAYYVLLSKYSGQEDIVVGTAVAGRSHADVERMIGMFVSTLALRSCPVGSKTFAEYLQEVHRESLAAFEHQQYPYEELIEQLNLERDMSRNPLFDTMFVVQNTGSEELELEGLTVSPVTQPSQVSKFDWTVTVTETGDDITLDIEYATSLFKKGTIERMMCHYLELMSSALREPSQRLSELEMMTVAEREEILYRFNDTAADYPREKTVHQLFEEQVAMSPEQLAIAGGGERLSYRALNERANALAWELSERGVGSGSIVAIMADRSIEIVVGMLAVLKAGGAYLPVAPDYPAERIQYMLEDSEAKLMLVKSEYLHQCSYGIETIELKDAAVMEAKAEAPPGQEAQATDLVYMMYTSGSTGQPKGVMVEHRGVVRLVKNTNCMTFKAGSRLLQTGAQVFDPSAFEIWGSLLNGLELYVADQAMLLDPVLMRACIQDNKINLLVLSTPLFHQIAQSYPDTFQGLDELMLGGDVLSPKRAQEVMKACPGLVVINAYGPTENTVISSFWVMKQESDVNGLSSLPIGYPVAHSTAYIVNQYGQLLPPGIPGELWVGGDGVAKGYKNRNELTNERFGINPFTNAGRIYRTGDMAMWNPNGTLKYIGRNDNQVKIRGYRIEVGEIERVINTFEFVNEAVVVIVTKEEDKYICAYIATDHIGMEDQLKKQLMNHLPQYMIPSQFVFMDRLPLNPNGKVDLKALPEPEQLFDLNRAERQPRNQLEKDIVDVCSRILGHQAIGIHDNFFKFGGHSLKAIQVIAELKELGYDANIQQLFSYQTPAELAEAIHTTTRESERTKIHDQSEAEYFISKKLGVNCSFDAYTVDDQTFNILAVENLNNEFKLNVTEIVREHCAEYLHPHYIVDRNNEVTHVNAQITTEALAQMLTDVQHWADSFAGSILKGEAIGTYAASPSQYYHLLHYDFSGIVLKWDRYLDLNLLSEAFRSLLVEEEVMRSALMLSDNGYSWKVYACPDNVSLPILDVSMYDPSTRTEIITQIMKDFFLKSYQQPGTLQYRALVIKENLRDHLIVMPFSHSIFDYISSEVLKTKLRSYYEQLERGQAIQTRGYKREADQFQDFISHITKGPVSITDDELVQRFQLDEFALHARQISNKVEQMNQSSCTVVNAVVAMGSEGRTIHSEDMWSFSMDVLGDYFKQILELDYVPFWLTNYGRRFGERTFFNTIGEFIDYVPLLMDPTLKGVTNSRLIKESLDTIKEHHIHFSNLMFNLDMKAAYPKAFAALENTFLNMPINFNFLGEEASGEDGLAGVDLGDVNADDRSRIVCMIWHSQDNLHFTVILPFVSDREAEHNRLLEIVKKQLVHMQPIYWMDQGK